MSASDKYQLENVKVTVHPDGVAHVELNRPKNLNTFSEGLIRDILAAFTALSDDQDVRAIVLSGSGRMFTAGLDLKELRDKPEGLDHARLTYSTRHFLKWFQSSITSLEECTKPIISVIHSGCIGAGVDLITASDIRYASKDAVFCVKEVDVGLAADVGTLQRLPKVIGNQSLVRELCLTSRNMYADEALQCGLVNRVEDTKEKALEEAFKVARNIASKSPVAVVGTKHLLNYSRDRTTADGLAYTLTWNSSMLNTDDIPISVKAFMTKKPPKYAKL
ncbi:ClpP/crotonase-like domain-containing protein [Dichotomocladium elegans]|nr:ClpP/crotonase-like domain-containing protein [Dichotomocladium elegans]